MSIMTVTTRITRRYLENKTKSDLAQFCLDLLDDADRLEVWWHKEWHQATGIPCDGSKEYCPLARKQASESPTNG